MLVGLISDAHGNAPGLEAVLGELGRHEVTRILFAGDAVGYYPYPNEVIDQLRAKGAIGILGNHESYLFGRSRVSDERYLACRLGHVERVISRESQAWLARLSSDCRLELDGLRILLCHGSPWAVDEYIYPESGGFERFTRLAADVIIMGHTHVPMMKRVGETLVVNPGSCGQPRDYIPGACYGLLDTQTGQVGLHRVGYDLQRLLEELRLMDYPGPLIDILRRVKGEATHDT